MMAALQHCSSKCRKWTSLQLDQQCEHSTAEMSVQQPVNYTALSAIL